MDNLKIASRKYHKILGFIFALPLLYSATTGILFVIAEDIFHNEGLAEFFVKCHTLEIIRLGDVYPFILLAGIIGLVTTALIMTRKNKA